MPARTSRPVALLRAVELPVLIALVAIGIAVFAWPRLASSRFVVQRRVARSLERAREQLPARRFDDARGELRAALRLEPGNAEARSLLASMELGVGNLDVAFLEFQALTEMQPQDPDGWIGIARLMVKGGLLAAPESALDKAISAAPKRADARSLRGEIRFRLGRYHGARVDAEAALAEAPDHPGASRLLLWTTARLQRRGGDDSGPPPLSARRFRLEAQSTGDGSIADAREHWPGRMAQMRQALESYMRQQSWSEADRVVESARRAYPDTAFAPFLAGIVQLARGEADEAEKHLTESLKAAPRSPVVITALAKAWSRKKGASFAARRLMELAERDPDLSFARLLAARAHLDAREPVEAEAAIRRGFVLQPDSPIPYVHLANYYLEVDRAAEAMGTLERGLDQFPHDLELQLFSARTNAEQGRSSDAIRTYQDVLARRPDLDVVEYKLAALLASQEDPGSKRHLVRLVEDLQSDEPSDPLLLDALGWAQSRVGDLRRARALLEAAVSAAPDEPGPHYHLAAIHARENRAELARSELKAAVESKRPFAERLDALRLLRKDTDSRRSAP